MFKLELVCILRLLLAGICGIIVGLERKNRSKEAGIRTHFIVACGAAAIMIVSKYAFFDVGGIADKLNFSGEIRIDPSRVASTIASGIGFLGAGMIFVHKNTITGLTTAAGIWATSGIGMAIGAGLYILGIGATFIILLAQILLHINFHHAKASQMKILSIKNVSETGYRAYLAKVLEERGIRLHNISVEKTDDETKNYIFTIELPETTDEDEILNLIGYKCSIKPCL